MGFFITQKEVSDESRKDSLFSWHITRKNVKNCPTQTLPRNSQNAGCCLVCLSQALLGGERLHERPLSWHYPNWSIFLPLHFLSRIRGKAWSAVLAVLQCFQPYSQQTKNSPSTDKTKQITFAGKLHCCSGNTQSPASWHNALINPTHATLFRTYLSNWFSWLL